MRSGLGSALVMGFSLFLQHCSGAPIDVTFVASDGGGGHAETGNSNPDSGPPAQIYPDAGVDADDPQGDAGADAATAVDATDAATCPGTPAPSTSSKSCAALKDAPGCPACAPYAFTCAAGEAPALAGCVHGTADAGAGLDQVCCPAIACVPSAQDCKNGLHGYSCTPVPNGTPLPLPNNQCQKANSQSSTEGPAFCCP